MLQGKITPLKHQLDGIEWILRYESENGGILADEPGLGKKHQIITAISKNPKQRTLIVVPYAALNVWSEQLGREHLNNVILNNEDAWNSLSEVEEVAESTYYLINYQKMQRRPRLQHIEWDRIIFDDAFILQNPHSRCYTAAIELKAKIRWIITSDLPSDTTTFFNLLKVRPDPDLILRRQLYRIIRGPPVPDIFKIDSTFNDVGLKILNKLNGPTVIYCRFIHEVLTIKSQCDELDRPVYCVHKEQEAAERKENLQMSMMNDQSILIVCSRNILPQLQLHTFKNIIFNNSSINEKHLERLIRRVVCIGQYSIVKIFLLSSL
jgi:hypothetical protein